MMRVLSRKQLSLLTLTAFLLAYTIFIQVYIETQSLQQYYYQNLARQYAPGFFFPLNEQLLHAVAVHSLWKNKDNDDAHYHHHHQRQQQQRALIPVRTKQQSPSEYYHQTSYKPNLTQVQNIHYTYSWTSNNKRPNIYNDPWLQTRLEKGRLESWYYSAHQNSSSPILLKENADADGPILDFIIAGWPKCGTTTLQANLAKYAPMPASSDICTPIHKTVWYAYQNWPQKFNNNSNNHNNSHTNAAANTTIANTNVKILRGTKCPRHIYDLQAISKHLPRSKIIIGIRHPVLWFSSFWNMLAHNDRKYLHRSPYEKTTPCQKANCCKDGCPKGNLFCVHRAQFHLGLARMGKTNLTSDELKWLSPQTFCGGHRFAVAVAKHPPVVNPVFLYDQTQLSHDYVWDGLADFLQFPPNTTIEHDRYQSSHGRKMPWGLQAEIDICQAQYDELRQIIMPIAYELSVWLTDYFIPLAEDTTRNDVVIPNPSHFRGIVQSYRQDPCGRLVRDESNGSYELRVPVNNNAT